MEDPEHKISSFLLVIGLTFDQIAKAIGKNEVWLAAAFYGQVRIALKIFDQHIDFHIL